MNLIINRFHTRLIIPSNYADGPAGSTCVHFLSGRVFNTARATLRGQFRDRFQEQSGRHQSTVHAK